MISLSSVAGFCPSSSFLTFSAEYTSNSNLSSVLMSLRKNNVFIIFQLIYQYGVDKKTFFQQFQEFLMKVKLPTKESQTLFQKESETLLQIELDKMCGKGQYMLASQNIFMYDLFGKKLQKEMNLSYYSKEKWEMLFTCGKVVRS